MKHFLIPILLTLMLSSLVYGCSSLADEPDDSDLAATYTPKPSPSSTITIQWFPATATQGPIIKPTQTLTPVDMEPGISQALFSDQFDVTSHWNLGQSPIGSMAFGQNELTLAIAKPQGVLTSLRDGPVLDDFEFSVKTEASLCKTNDHYGIIFRAASNQDFYRFMVSCAGNMRLDRVRSGITNPLVNWAPSGQVPPGSPVSLKLSVWALGHDLRFFINDTYQYSVRDEAFSSGRIGLYARSTGTTAVTISFSDLVVHALDKEEAKRLDVTSTPTETPTKRP